VTSRLGPLAFVVLALGAALGTTGCLERTVAAEGQFGRLIPMAEGDVEVPRLAFRLEGCGESPGGCDQFCEDGPESCLAADADACMPILVDSSSPFTILPGQSSDYAIERRCFEVRAAGGLGIDPTKNALENAVARFRFLDPPIVEAPSDDVAGWQWEVGSDLASSRVGAVLGGNTLRHFAVAFRSIPDGSHSVAFFRDFPGDEAALADQGRAFVRLQFPSRLLGREVDDRCDVGGVDCELAGIDIRPDEEDLVYDGTRMLLDACIAPPACASRYESDPADPGAEPECRLRPGGVFETGECTPPTDAEAGGVSGTLVVATGLPDVVLFRDSVTRMFGAAEQLPACDDAVFGTPEGAAVRACSTGETGTLHAPGWPPLTDLMRLRVRAVALLPGNGSVTGPNPCLRLERRLLGLHAQCIDYAELAQPRQPRLTGDLEDGRLGYGMVVVGEAWWRADQEGPDTERWLDVLVVPETSSMVLALRRDVGTDALEPDGLIGTALLRETETVLDYTEDTEHPGLRVSCLNPASGNCLSAPACNPADPEEPADKSSDEGPDGRVGRVSCCFGLPQSLIGRVIREGAEKDPPRVEEACCQALDPEALAKLQSEDAELCARVDPL
jgi:hypothetical protein